MLALSNIPARLPDNQSIKVDCAVHQTRLRVLLFHLDLSRAVWKRGPQSIRRPNSAVQTKLREFVAEELLNSEDASLDSYYTRRLELLRNHPDFKEHARPGEYAREASCSICAAAPTICSGRDVDYLRRGPSPTCLDDLRHLVAIALSNALSLYAIDRSDAALTCQLAEDSSSVPVPVVRAFGLTGATKDNRVSIRIWSDGLSLQSWYALPIVIYHEVLVHCFQYMRAPGGWHATKPSDAFAEGLIDRLAHEALLTDLGSGAFDQVLGPSERSHVLQAATEMSFLRNSNRAGELYRDVDPYCNARQTGNAAYFALSSALRVRQVSQERMHRFLAELNTRSISYEMRQRIVHSLVELDCEVDRSLVAPLLELDADEVEKVCRARDLISTPS